MSKEKKLASVKTGLPSNLEVGLNIISQIMLVSVCKPGYSCLCSLQESVLDVVQRDEAAE